MKDLLFVLTFSFASSLAQAAVENPLPYIFAPAAPSLLVALDCPGATQLQLQQAKAWRDQGDSPFADYAFNSAEAFEQVRRHGNLVTHLGSAFALLDSPTSPLAKVNLSSDGHIDAGALGLPDEINGCAPMPFALNVKDQGGQYDFMLDASLYNRLSMADRYAARMLMRGFQENLVRTLLDANPPEADFAARKAKYVARGFHFMAYHSAEIVLNQNLVLGANGPEKADSYNLARRYHYDYAPEKYDQVYFDVVGRLRAVVSRGAYLTFTGFASKISDAASYGNPKGISCMSSSTIVYRIDGSLAFCWETYFTLGGSEQKVSTQLVGLPGLIYQRGDLAGRNETMPTQLALAEVSPNMRQITAITVQGLREELQSLSLIDNDPHCSGIAFQNAVSGKSNTLTITVPRHCVAMVKVTWKKI